MQGASIVEITTGPTFRSHRETVVISLSYEHKMAFTTYIFKEDLARLKRDADLLRETGGSLYGQWTSTGNPVVHVAMSKSGKYSDGVETFFFKNYRLCHIGEWCIANPDHRTREALLSKYKGSRPAKRFVILEVTADAAYPFLFVDGKSYGEGRVEALQGENPFNKAELLGVPSMNYPQGNVREQHRLPATGPEMRGNPVYVRSNQPPVSHFQQYPLHTRQPQVQDAHTSLIQWYANESGEEKLKLVFLKMKEMAMRNEVEMSRDTRTHDMSMSFNDKYRNRKWEVKFSAYFPHDGALVTNKSQALPHAPYRTSGGESVEKAVEDIKRYILRQ